MSEDKDKKISVDKLPDHWRQLALFRPDDFKIPVHIIGVGATGSHIADSLANIGVRTIIAYDFDKVEDHNLPNQIYSISHVGQLKVEALRDHILEKCGFEIEIRTDKVERMENLEGILFLCTDSMNSQKSILLSSARLNPKVPLVIETRMGLEEGRVYAFDPSNKIHLKKWMENWYSDEDAAEPVCTARAIATTAKFIAAIASHKVVTKFSDSSSLGWFHETIVALDCGTLARKDWDK